MSENYAANSTTVTTDGVSPATTTPTITDTTENEIYHSGDEDSKVSLLFYTSKLRA